MYGHHHSNHRAERAFWHMAGRFGGRGGFGSSRHGMGGGHGMRGGPGDMLRAGRILGDGDLKLITLALLAESPRHGYDIIKALEERSSGFYAPSPGVVYPTLTFLEEAGFATSAAEGNKKVFSITEAGQAHLADNQEVVTRLLDQIKRFGEQMTKARDWFGTNDEGEAGDSRGGKRGRRGEFHAVRHRIRAALGNLVDARAEKHAVAIAILEKAAEGLEALAGSK